MHLNPHENGANPLPGNHRSRNSRESKSILGRGTGYPQTHPSTPRGTSGVAALMAPSSQSQRMRIYEAICKAGSNGLIDQEGQRELGICTQSYTPRRGELHKLGLIRDAGERRCADSGCSAALWVAVTKRGDLDDA